MGVNRKPLKPFNTTTKVKARKTKSKTISTLVRPRKKAKSQKALKKIDSLGNGVAGSQHLTSLKCPDCPEEFSASQDKRNHLEKQHSFVKCEHCSSVKRTKMGIGQHMRKSHKDIKIEKIELKCQLCDYKTDV